MTFVDSLGLFSMDLASILLSQYMASHPDFARKVCDNWYGSGNEVGWFYINDPKEGYTLLPWPDHPDNTHSRVVPPSQTPPNALAEAHTHPDSFGKGNSPSPNDYITNLGLDDAFVFDPNFVFQYTPEKPPYVPSGQKEHDCIRRMRQ